MKQLEQMRGVTKCTSITLLALAVIYLVTRILAFIELRKYRERNMKTMTGSMAFKYSNIEVLHYFTIVHSITCVAIALFVFLMLRKNTVIDRR